MVVFENRFPSLATAVERDVPPSAPGNPVAELRPGFGRCEVVCFTDEHDRVFADLGPDRARLVVDVWADRTEALGAIDGVAYVYPFENHGEEIGVTLSHPHGQIYAYPYLPPRVEKILASARRHRESTGGDLFADVVAAERSGPRVVVSNEHWTAFVPAAARWPYEVQLFPVRKVPDLPALTDAERDAFVEVYLDVLARFARRFDTPMPYIASWNQAPVGEGREDWWLHLQLFSLLRAPGKMKYLAGSESGMGAFITDTNPEDVAEQLRTRGRGRVSAAERAAQAFAERFGTAPEGVWAAPGRVNVIGEHTDYNDGFVLPVALPHTTRAAVARRTDGRVALASLQGDGAVVELALTDLAPGRPDGWAGYPAGVVDGLRDRLAGGVSVLVDTDVPVGAGLSSSAALTCSVALALSDLVAPELTRTDLVELARRSENDFVGAPTGILDQSASLLCEAGNALFLDTRTRVTEQVPLDLAAAGLELLVVDTGTSHTHADGGYGDRRRECEEAAARLGVPALRDITDVAAAGAPWTTRSCGAGPGTSSPRTPGCSRSSRILRGDGGPAVDRAGAQRGPRVPARRLRDLDARAGRLRRPPPSTRERTVPAWSAAASAAAPSCWSTATGPRRSPRRCGIDSRRRGTPRRGRSTSCPRRGRAGWSDRPPRRGSRWTTPCNSTRTSSTTRSSLPTSPSSWASGSPPAGGSPTASTSSSPAVRCRRG